MRLNSKWNRRSFLGSVGVLAGSIGTPRKLFSLHRGATGASPKHKTATVTGFGQSGNPYEELAVTTVINCEGTMTVLGGSLLHPELSAALTTPRLPFFPTPQFELPPPHRTPHNLKLPP